VGRDEGEVGREGISAAVVGDQFRARGVCEVVFHEGSRAREAAVLGHVADSVFGGVSGVWCGSSIEGCESSASDLGDVQPKERGSSTGTVVERRGRTSPLLRLLGTIQGVRLFGDCATAEEAAATGDRDAFGERVARDRDGDSAESGVFASSCGVVCVSWPSCGRRFEEAGGDAWLGSRRNPRWAEGFVAVLGGEPCVPVLHDLAPAKELPRGALRGGAFHPKALVAGEVP